MKIRQMAGVGLAALFGGALLSCADWDNPTALEDLVAETEFEVEAARVETFQEVEIHVHITEGGAPLVMREAQLEIEHGGAEEARVVPLEPAGEGYAAHVTFHEPGEHHVHFVGRPEQHQLMHELGDQEIEVHRQHQIIGPYWVELDVNPAPVLIGESGHIHFHVFELLEDGTPGEEVAGLVLECELHAPDASEISLVVVEEEPGEYETEYTFAEAGLYEFHLEIEIAEGVHEDGEFHVPVLSSLDDEDHEEDTDEGGDDHGHGH